MGFFKKNNENNSLESIYVNNILYNIDNKSIIIKNGFSKKEFLINEIIDFGIGYGMTYHNADSIYEGKKQDGGLERYFSGYYTINEIPPISIFIRLKNDKFIFYPLTITTTKKGRTLFTAEKIFDKLDSVLNTKKKE